jgi:hypothetical protein
MLKSQPVWLCKPCTDSAPLSFHPAPSFMGCGPPPRLLAPVRQTGLVAISSPRRSRCVERRRQNQLRPICSDRISSAPRRDRKL